jgi:hypothetical protein
MGYRRIEADSETPANYSLLTDDPYPITIFGLTKPISSNKISKYLTPEFYHYAEIYKNVKNYGLPWNWLTAPRWLLEMINQFDDISDEYYKYKHIRGIL